MKKYILLYRGSASPKDQMSAEQGKASDSVRRTWIEKVGAALVDVGSPMTGGKALVDNGSVTQASDFSGYSIIEAENIDDALKLIEGNPFLMDKTGRYSIEVFELIST